MSTFNITILGCSSATPTADRHPSSQLLHINENAVLIDCGEGTQNQMIKYHIKYNKIDYILISHLHGDHFLGLPGLLSTMSLNGRQKKLILIGPIALKNVIESLLEVIDTRLQFEVDFIPTDPNLSEMVISTDQIQISTFPLKHRIPCTGFLLKEVKDPRKILVDKCTFHQVPVEYFSILKRGKDYFKLDGTVIPNSELTSAASIPKSYAYCSDTIYDEDIIPYIQGVDLLYHESTFTEDLIKRAIETYHSTAKQAGTIAQKAHVKQLIIGHFSARYHNLDILLNEAKSVFENTLLAKEGQIFSI